MKTIALIIAISLAIGILAVQIEVLYKRYKNRQTGMPKWKNPPPVPPKNKKHG